MSAPVFDVDVCMKDAEELRDIAAYFDVRGKGSSGDFLRAVANRHEVLVRTGATELTLRTAARNFFAWANKTWPNPCGNDNHPWSRLAEVLAQNDENLSVMDECFDGSDAHLLTTCPKCGKQWLLK